VIGNGTFPTLGKTLGYTVPDKICQNDYPDKLQPDETIGNGGSTSPSTMDSEDAVPPQNRDYPSTT
jgi:hypothetical protein